MSYRNHYSGSPWQQGGPPFGMSGYGQSSYGGYNDQYSMMSSGYGRNQGGYGSMYGGGGGMGQMRSMGYGGLSPSRYGSDRMSGSRQMMSRGQMQRKRLPQRSPAGGPRSKRPNLGNNDRRLSKPRRRRDSRGGSKGRGRDHSDDDDDDTYNPEEPTDDASDIDCDGYESWKCSSGDDENEKNTQKENGEQNDKDAAEGEKKEDAKSVPKKIVCYVCKVTCSSEIKHRKHQASKTHTDKIDELLAIRREKKAVSKDDKEISDKEGKDNKRKSSRKPDNWCTVCECVFNGNFLAHRRTKEHRKKRDKKYPKCRPCRMGFSSLEEYRDHYKSEEHKNMSAEFHYLKGFLSGCDEDEDAILPVKVELPEEESPVEIKEEMEVDGAEVKEEKVDEEKDEKADEGKDEKTKEEKEGAKDEVKKDGESKRSRPPEPKAVGQMFVVSVQGYFCKLCHKYFKDGTTAKYKHCRSIMHAEAFKKAMIIAVEQEEERQRLSDEQDKLEQKAMDDAELAAEIQAIERAAKEAARREAAKRKADKSDDVEIKDSAEGDAASDEGKDDKEDEEKAEANGIKADSQESGIEKEEEKGSNDDKPAEPQEEGDEEGDEEQEKEVTKEEVTSSPATRRGRGRGRGRKRR